MRVLSVKPGFRHTVTTPRSSVPGVLDAYAYRPGKKSSIFDNTIGTIHTHYAMPTRGSGGFTHLVHLAPFLHRPPLGHRARAASHRDAGFLRG